MRRYLPVLALLFVLLLAAFSSSPAAAAEGTSSSKSSVLCMPGIYTSNPGDCAPLGPSSYLTEMAEKGITFPLTPLPAKKPDFSYTYIDYRYGLIRTPNAPVYSSPQDAISNNKKAAVSRISAPFSYISYTEEYEENGKRAYMIEPGMWMGATDVIRIGAVPLFQGLVFSRTPERSFGWVLTYLYPTEVISKRTPGLQVQDYTGRVLGHQEIVQVYARADAPDGGWVMIGPDEWIPERVVAEVYPNTTPPEGVTNGRWIEVNLYEQTISVYEDRELVFATIMASGFEPLWTRPGLFKIYQKVESTPMRGSFSSDGSDAYYLEDVPWTMYFDEARALHGAYWRTQLGFPQSHGCVNLSVGDARWLFEWANEGDWVWVHDPSGQTPTDPSLYTAGGA
ncbi:MAG: L,D-transpeptidase [Chloroflexi bacterium]|nr:L,D-transpeptidase [Chloroflexota bacterium]